MTLLLSTPALVARRPIAEGSLSPLAASLAHDLNAVIDRPLYLPEQKALLSKDGGRCARDGTLLDFDPFSPDVHRCPKCGERYTGELHHRFWIYWYQLWLAERAVHGAVLGALGVLPKGTAFAMSILDAYADRYPTYPNTDNVLGPTRPFFSTYLESIWLLQLCVALDLVERSSDPRSVAAVGGRFRDVVVLPSRSLIRGYDEGMSNRQVWNNSAMIAASRLVGRNEDAEYVIWSESGLAAHLGQSLLADGTWYEGENYHLFAHRGLWYSVIMAETAGFELPTELVTRFDAGFAAPFLTALPDFTLPSRRDSQYGISLRQWRFAEMCELGLARQDDRKLASPLSRLYEPDIPRGETGRSTASAEAERNVPASALSRNDLGWKSLLFAKPEPLAAGPSTPPSVLLDAQGIGVLRRDTGRVYAALDYGHSGGGHGHPDRLNLLLVTASGRVLDDYGTGSYVDDSLHWYRSTLAHNAPLIDGRSQLRVNGDLIAFEDRGAAGWIAASAPIAPGAIATRTVVAMPDYLLDEMEWSAPLSRLVDLPVHIDAELVGRSPLGITATLEGGAGLEDGFRFLHDTVQLATGEGGEVIRLRAQGDRSPLDLWVGSDSPFEIWRATAPGAPGRGDAPFLMLRSKAAAGAFRSLWSWGGAVESVVLYPTVVVVTTDARHEHQRVAHGWNIAIVVGEARSSIDLEGQMAPTESELSPALESVDELRAIVLRPDRPVELTLREESYRRSEDSWEEAGEPTARVAFVNENGALVIEASASHVEQTFASAGAVNPLDNEHADINGAGMQLYLRTEEALAGYVIVPVPGGDRVTVRPIDGWGAGIPIDALWTSTDDGFVIEVRVDAMVQGVDTVVNVDVIINERPAGRERRRGQLVLSGGGDFVYLRGDRHDPSRLIPFLLTDV